MCEEGNQGYGRKCKETFSGGVFVRGGDFYARAIGAVATHFVRAIVIGRRSGALYDAFCRQRMGELARKIVQVYDKMSVMSELTKSQKMSIDYQRVMVSKAAYQKMKELANDPKYYGRGIVGVVDDMFLGEFTTQGSGRVPGSRNRL